MRLRQLIAGLLVSATLLGGHGAAAADYELTARFDWRSEGEIYQVWFHREFDGLLLQTAPLQVEAGPVVRNLLDGVTVVCNAHTAIGLPNWSVTTGTCTLTQPNGTVTLEVEDCSGTQKLCQGTWSIIGGTGDFANFTGGGTTEGHLVEPDPLPWLWDGPTAGFNILRGTLTIP